MEKDNDLATDKVAYNNACVTRISLSRYGCFQLASWEAIADIPNGITVSHFADGPPEAPTLAAVSRAADALRSVLRITPEEDGAWSDLAWLYALDGNIDTAIVAEQRAIALYKYDYTYYVLLGTFYEKTGRLAEAQSTYVTALSLYPRLLTSTFWHRLQLRQPALAQRAPQLGLQALAQHTLVFDEVSRSEIRARLLAATGQLDTAANISRSVSAELPNRSGMWELQGELDEEKGDTVRALLNYRRASFLDASDPLPHQRSAALRLSKLDLEGSRDEGLLAWQLTQRLKSPAAQRRRVQYHREDDLGDDQLPLSLVVETQPSFDFNHLFTRLSLLFAAQGLEVRSEEMQHLADETNRDVMNFGFFTTH